MPPRQQQARNLRIERQLGQLMTQRGEFSLIINRVQLRQELVTIRDHARRRRLDERKFRDIAQLERAHAQDDCCQRHPENFRIGKFDTLQKVGFVVQTYANATHHPPAPPRTLISGSA